jgi:hypothetical protein
MALCRLSRHRLHPLSVRAVFHVKAGKMRSARSFARQTMAVLPRERQHPNTLTTLVSAATDEKIKLILAAFEKQAAAVLDPISPIVVDV